MHSRDKWGCGVGDYFIFIYLIFWKKENNLVQLICKHIGGKLGVGGGSILGLNAAFQ